MKRWKAVWSSGATIEIARRHRSRMMVASHFKIAAAQPNPSQCVYIIISPGIHVRSPTPVAISSIKVDGCCDAVQCMLFFCGRICVNLWDRINSAGSGIVCKHSIFGFSCSILILRYCPSPGMFPPKIAVPFCFFVELTMVSALIAPLTKSAGCAHTLTKFGGIVDHLILMQTDMSIIFVSQFLVEIQAFYVYHGAVSQIWLTSLR